MSTIKKALILLPFLYLAILPGLAEAATITACSFNKDLYNQGDTGYISVTVYNDKDNKVRVTDLTATIDHYYTDENVYLQTFYADENLPIEIERGQLIVLTIPFSLPTNIAPGYIEMHVKAETEVWNAPTQIWFWSDHPTYSPRLYVESPYKRQAEIEKSVNEGLQEQLAELQSANLTTTNLVYLLGLTTIGFMVAAVVTILLSRRRPAASGTPV